MRSLAHQLALISMTGRTEFVKLMAAGADGTELSLMTPIDGMRAIVLPRGEEIACVLANDLTRYSRRAACDAVAHEFYAAGEALLAEFGKRHVSDVEGYLRALREMEMRREEMLTQVAVAVERHFVPGDQPTVMHAQHMYLEAAFAFGQLFVS